MSGAEEEDEDVSDEEEEEEEEAAEHKGKRGAKQTKRSASVKKKAKRSVDDDEEWKEEHECESDDGEDDDDEAASDEEEKEGDSIHRGKRVQYDRAERFDKFSHVTSPRTVSQPTSATSSTAAVVHPPPVIVLDDSEDDEDVKVPPARGAVDAHLLDNDDDDDGKVRESKRRGPPGVDAKRSGAGRWHCTVAGCNKSYGSKQGLGCHINWHTGVKPYKCTVEGCGNSFSKTNHLTAHMRIHSSEKPFACTYAGCDKAFTQKCNLERHMRIHSGERPFACTVAGCDKAFTQKGHLDTHMRFHTGDKPYKCTVEGCDKAFTQKCNLDTHTRIHTGDKPYTCESCGKSFSDISSLAAHKLTHDKDLPAYKAMQARQAEAQRRKLKKVREHIQKLRVEFGCQEKGKEGMCADCGVFPATDLHHLDPSRKGKGDRRKGSYALQGLSPQDEGGFGNMYSVRQIEAELKRNTERRKDGTVVVHLVALDANCHAARHFSERSKERAACEQKRYDYMNVVKRNYNGGHCAAPNCPSPGDICREGEEYKWDLDHLHPKGCICGQLDCIAKVASISSMAKLTVRYSDKEFQLHCSARCVRLLHMACHRQHTAQQWKSGVFNEIRRAAREEAAELAELGVVEDDELELGL